MSQVTANDVFRLSQLGVGAFTFGVVTADNVKVPTKGGDGTALTLGAVGALAVATLLVDPFDFWPDLGLSAARRR